MSQMSSGFSRQTARNIFYGSTVFFALLLAALVFDSEQRVPERSNAQALTPAVARGKLVWEENDCNGCHTILGEGAYFAPELGNVYKRRGGDNGGAEFIKNWIKAQPTNAVHRHQMPQLNLTDQQLNDLVEFLKWTGQINAEQWPPNIEG